MIAVSNGSGAVTNVNAYDESGIPASTNVGRFQYTGQQWIAELGMYHYRARIYSPTLGRFLQTDPIGYGDGMNLHTYVGNDPINLIDPTGQRRLTPGERAMLGIFGPFADSLRSISLYRNLLVTSPLVFPRSIEFTPGTYRPDFSGETRSSEPVQTFYHEFYHHFEMLLGIVTLGQLVANQIGSDNSIYDYNPALTFMRQNPEARAQYFSQCITGNGSCSALDGFRYSPNSATTITFQNGSFVVRVIQTGSRIPYFYVVSASAAKNPDEILQKPANKK